MKNIIEKLNEEKNLSFSEMKQLLLCDDDESIQYLFKTARAVREEIYGKDIYFRGLIEISNICKNDCYYCGIRRSNSKCERYRLTKDDILECCKDGYNSGFRTFVLQGGEDSFFNDEYLTETIKEIKSNFSECAITLSLGEKSRESYQKLFDAGAARYLLRHETASESHYMKLHPKEMSYNNRVKCLQDLKEIGYQVGCGFMVGSPFQSVELIINDMKFISDLKPQMVGIGPFIPHCDTPFAAYSAGNVKMTLKCLSIIRLLLPDVLLPATTALGTLENDGREKGVLAGANVVMPNLSPISVRKKYMLYNNKLSSGKESAECLEELRRSFDKIGYNLKSSRGDIIYHR